MTDILSEYTARHNLPLSIYPLTEGLVFFEHDNKNKYILLISSVSKSYKLCKECYENNNSIVFEILTFNSLYEPLVSQVHKHYNQEFDLLKEFKSYVGNKCYPIAINSHRKLEEYIWNTFITLKEITLKTQNSMIDDMLFISSKNFSIFEQYYLNLYSPLVINRKYLYK